MTDIQSGYGLMVKSTQKLLGVYPTSIDDADGTNPHYTLTESDGAPWIVKDKLTASYVRLNSTEWYNAGYDTPINPFDPEKLEVVKIEITATVEEPTYIPTIEEYMNSRYNTPGKNTYDPGHYATIMKEIKKGVPYKVQLYNLRED